MSNEELVELIRSGKNVKANMAQLYKQNRGLIWKLTVKYQSVMEMEDLMQEAYFILDQAVQTYDPSRLSFASWLGMCLSYLMPRQILALNGVKIPVHQNELMNKYSKFIDQYSQDHGMDPSDQDIMAALDISDKQLSIVKRTYLLIGKKSLDDIVNGQDEITLGDCIEDDHDQYEPVEDELDQEYYKAVLNDALSVLTDKQRNVIRLRMKGLTFAEVCRELDINNRQSAQQSEQNSLKKIRRHLINNGTYRILYEDAYRGSLTAFNYTHTSTPERIAIKHFDMVSTGRLFDR